jgi:hypothetical protein
MCWTAAASAALGATGVGTAIYLNNKGEPKAFTIPLAYFSLMEFIQFASYASIDHCSFTANTALTFVSWVHIAFQPFFLNMFLIRGVRKKVSAFAKRTAYAVSLLVAAILLLKIVPFAPESLCSPGQSLCGTTMCTVSGNWHLAWSIPYYNFPFPGDAFIYYAFAVFLVPLFYGAWLGVLRTFLTGPLLAYILTGGNPLEWASVWCLFSVGLILSLLISRRYFRFKSMRF